MIKYNFLEPKATLSNEKPHNQSEESATGQDLIAPPQSERTSPEPAASSTSSDISPNVTCLWTGQFQHDPLDK